MKGNTRVVLPFHASEILHPEVVKQILKVLRTRNKFSYFDSSFQEWISASGIRFGNSNLQHCTS